MHEKVEKNKFDDLTSAVLCQKGDWKSQICINICFFITFDSVPEAKNKIYMILKPQF
jgi:hypothetical protein